MKSFIDLDRNPFLVTREDLVVDLKLESKVLMLLEGVEHGHEISLR